MGTVSRNSSIQTEQMEIGITIASEKENQQLYKTKFNQSRFREGALDKYYLESFSRIEGFDYDYLRYEIQSCNQTSTLLYRLGVYIKRYLKALRDIAPNPRIIHIPQKKASHVKC